MKALACLILCFAPLAIASGGQADAPVPGKVTLQPMQSGQRQPCNRWRILMPTLRRIDPTDARSEESDGVTALVHEKVYNRGGSLVGTVTGADIGKIKSYVTQAKGG
jgi:hypothetical protein